MNKKNLIIIIVAALVVILVSFAIWFGINRTSSKNDANKPESSQTEDNKSDLNVHKTEDISTQEDLKYYVDKFNELPEGEEKEEVRKKLEEFLGKQDTSK